MTWWTRFRLWWNKKSGGTPLSNETPVQVAPMLNCPLWGVTTPDTCDTCPFFGGRIAPPPHAPPNTLAVIKCRFNGRVTPPEQRVLDRHTEQGLDVDIFRCVSCGNPYLDIVGLDVPVCPRNLCQSRVQYAGVSLLTSARRDTLSPRRGRRRREDEDRLPNGNDEERDEEGSWDAKVESVRSGVQEAPPGQAAGEEAGEGSRGV